MKTPGAFAAFAVVLLFAGCEVMRRGTGEDRSQMLSRRFDRAVFHADRLDLPYRLLRPLARDMKPRPLLIYFHGAGERGTDNERTLTHILPFLSRSDLPVDEMYVLVPQCPPENRWVETDWGLPSHRQPAMPSRPMSAVLALLDRLNETEAIDSSRVYVMGLSMGGFAVWDILARSPERFAAGVPVCGGADESTAPVLRGIPLRVFHGAKDRVVIPDRSRRMVAALKRLGADVGYTEYRDVAHGSWVPAFQDPDLARWLLSRRRQERIGTTF